VLAVLTATVFSAIGRAHTHLALKTHQPSVSPSEQAIAHTLYLQGRFEWSKRTPESLHRALDDFNQSLVHDPTSAPSYAGVADTYLLLREYTPMPEREAYSHAIAAATMAVTLDDSLAEAHRSLAFAEVWGNWDFRAGEREFRRAIQLDSRDPLTHLWFATAFESPEWYAATQREFDRAQELDPSSATVLANKSIWLFESGRIQDGLAMARQVEQADPNFVAPHRYLADMNWHLRDYPAFLAETEQTARLKHDPQLAQIAEAARTGYTQSGESGLLRHLYATQKQLYTAGKLYGEPLAVTCVRLGDKEQAMQLLQDDLAHRRPGVLGILTDADLRTLQGDPRFQQILARLDFPPPPSADNTK
jgi:Tfp pilus assembly protein PilF